MLFYARLAEDMHNRVYAMIFCSLVFGLAWIGPGWAGAASVTAPGMSPAGTGDNQPAAGNANENVAPAPPELANALKSLAAQEKALQEALVVERGEKANMSDAVVAAMEFGKLAGQVPALSKDLPEEKRAMAEQIARKLTMLAADVEKYARQSDAADQARGFLWQLQSAFKGLLAQYPPAWTKP